MDLKELILGMKAIGIKSINLNNDEIHIVYTGTAFDDAPATTPIIEKQEVIPAPITATDLATNQDLQSTVTVDEAAELTGWSRYIIMHQIHTNLLPAMKRSREYRIKLDDLTEWADARKIPEGWSSVDTVRKQLDLSRASVHQFVHKYNIPSKVVSKIMYIDVDTLMRKRADYEIDVLCNDGHRRGPVKMVTK